MRALINGVLIGFSIAAPVGPIGLLCIQRSLAGGLTAGFVTGLGAATADALYGCVVAFGFGAVSAALLAYQVPMALLGGLFLCWMGLATMARKPVTQAAAAEGPLAGTWASTLLLTLTNPATVLSFTAIIASQGQASTPGTAAALELVAGVFLGSALWWLLLSGASSLARTRLSDTGMRWINRASGAMLLGFGMLALTRPAGT